MNKFQVTVLSDSLTENSGLDFFNGQLLTFNDGGNSSELFILNEKTGGIHRKLLTGMPNRDWEAICNDGSSMYIGDFGNNDGSRRDLVIYKMAMDSVVRAPSSNNAPHQNSFAEEIPFYYPEQSTFNSQNLNTDYDAEAMIFLHGKIHVFTKEWRSKSTTHYTLDAENLNIQQAVKVETFKTGFMVTDAAYYDQKLYLLGYTKKTEVFLEVFHISENQELFFSRPLKQWYLGSALTLGQVEGIAVNKEGIYISGEKFQHPLGSVSQKFFHIPAEKLKW